MVCREECARRFLEAMGFAQAVLRKSLSNELEDVVFYSTMYNVKDHTNAYEWFDKAEYWYRLSK